MSNDIQDTANQEALLAQYSAVLELDIAELEDLPDFRPFPNGVHNVKVSFEFKELLFSDKETGGKVKTPCIDISFELIETVEQEDPAEAPCKAGDKASMLCSLTNKYGEGHFKRISGPIAERLGTRSIKALLEESKSGVECQIVSNSKKDKNGEIRFGVRELTVL